MGLKIDGEIRLHRIDREGNEKELLLSKKFDSFNYNFMRWLCNSFAGSALTQVVDTGGTSRSIDYDGILNCIAGGDVQTFGIRVGTDGTATVAGDYNLHAIVNDGTTDGTLVYYSNGVSTVDTSGSDVRLNIIRAFLNLGTTTITLRELDLVTNTGSYFVEILRDTFADTQVFQYGGVSVHIIIKITVA